MFCSGGDMTISKLAILAAVAAIAGASAVSAQSLRNLSVPAEFPPASYAGNQYVDSRGCVFIRAGVGANTNWVPRLTNTREQMCGFAPSLAGAAPAPQPQAAPQPRTATAPAPRAQPAPQPQTRAVAASTPRAQAPRAVAAAPAPRQQAAPQQTRRVTAPAPVRATAAPAPQVVRVQTAPAPRATPVQTNPVQASASARPAGNARVLTPPDPGRTACANLSGVSAAYMVQHNGSPVRCGPQTASYVTYAGTGSARGSVAAVGPAPGTRATPATVPPGTRIAPRRVYQDQVTSLAGIAVPPGMMPVWDDDRLNPRRAHQTFEGKAQMEVMWTNTVPRRLIDRQTGQDVIHKFPGLQPPFTSFEQQRAAGVQVATRGVYVPDPVTVRRNTAPRAAQVARAAPSPAPQAVAQAPVPRATVSTRSDPVAARPRYVQAGVYADPAQARAAAGRIAATGLPARQGKLTRDGRELTMVLAGPFTSEAEARRGVARLSGMGFANLRLR